MASSTQFYKILIVFVAWSFFVGLIFAQLNNQLPRDSATDVQGSSFFFYQKPEYPRDCSEVRESCPSSLSSSVYLIKPDGYTEPFEAYCNMDNDSGGWTVILRRLDGAVDFKRNCGEYKRGFGFLSAELWLGNDKLSFLTNQAQYELRIEITMENGTSCDVRYNAFRISDEWSDYTITCAEMYQRDAACKWENRDNSTPTPVARTFADCNDVYSAGNTQDGVYSILPAGWNGSPFDAFCNMSIDGGNWTVIQRRVNGSTDFYQNWASYKEGFGNIQHEFWLGNEKIYYLTKQATYEYRFDYVFGSSSYHNKYSRFRIDNEANKYKVTDLGSRTGTRGYSLHNTLNIEFSTYDQDNDERSYDCAAGHRGGWWYGGHYNDYTPSHCTRFQSGSRHVFCTHTNANGDYDGGNGKNIFDGNYHNCNIKYTEMKIRQIL